MHDPCTVAFDIRNPFSFKKYPDAIVTIWHEDPETDGSDDSCGWSRAKLTDADRKLAKELAEWEREWPYFFAQRSSESSPRYPGLRKIAPGDAAMLVLEAWTQIAWRLERHRLTPREGLRAMQLGHSAHDNFAGSFASSDVDEYESTFLWIIRAYRSMRRPWYRHPRWHVWHWRLQVHGLQNFKRWAFTRCAECGKRFKWGQSGVGTWSGTGPQWFKSEVLTHMKCDRAKAAQSEKAS